MEHIFGRAAKRANPIVRDVLEFGAWGDAAVRITDFWIIDVAAKRADILIHIFSSKGDLLFILSHFPEMSQERRNIDASFLRKRFIVMA